MKSHPGPEPGGSRVFHLDGGLDTNGASRRHPAESFGDEAGAEALPPEVLPHADDVDQPDLLGPDDRRLGLPLADTAQQEAAEHPVGSDDQADAGPVAQTPDQPRAQAAAGIGVEPHPVKVGLPERLEPERCDGAHVRLLPVPNRRIHTPMLDDPVLL